MEKTLVIFFVLFAFVIGIIGGVVFAPADVETIYEEKTVKVPINVSVVEYVEVPTADVGLYRNQAVEDFIDYIDDEELFECDGYDYDFNEIIVSRVYDEITVTSDGEDTTVEFTVRLKYDEEDERSCRSTFDVEAFYEKGEEVEITV